MREDFQETLEKLYPRGFFIVGLMENGRGDMLLWDRDGIAELQALAEAWDAMTGVDPGESEEDEENDTK